MDETLLNNQAQDTDVSAVVTPQEETVDLEAESTHEVTMQAEMESRSQEELLAQELSAMKGVAPETVGMSLEPAMATTVKTYESLGMPDPETLAMSAIYEGLDNSLTDQEKKAKVDAMKAEYDAWKASQVK